MKKVVVCDKNFKIVGATAPLYRRIRGYSLLHPNTICKLIGSKNESIDITPLIIHNKPFTLLQFDEEPFNLLKTIIDSTLEGILLSYHHTILYVNQPLLQLSGFTLEEVVGKNLLHWVHPDFRQTVIRKIEKNDTTPYEIKILHKKGNYFWVLVKGRSITLGQNTYRITGFVDIDTQKQAIEHYRKKASRDPLTGFYHRNALAHLLLPHITYALFFIDIDNFKTINDTFGHSVGDRCLKEFAQTLQKGFRKEDILARIGGDEFVLIAPLSKTSQAKEEAILLAQKLQTLLRSISCEVEKETIRIKASIGVTLFEGKDLDKAIERADQAMYRAKKTGKNRIFTLF